MYLNTLFIFSFFFNLNFAQGRNLVDFSNENYSVKLNQYSDYQEILLEGEFMPFKMGSGMKDVYKNLVDGQDILLVVNESYGGVFLYFQKLKRKMRKACAVEDGCKITVYIRGYCASSCTFIPLYGDDAYASAGSTFSFHREWAIHPKMVTKTKKSMAREYIDEGANEEWMMNHLNFFDSEHQVYGYDVPAGDVIDGGFLDGIESYSYFRSRYRQ